MAGADLPTTELQRRDPESPESGPPIAFLICSPRSGSTLLTRMMAGHPRVFAPPELHLLPPLFHLGYHASVVDPGFDTDYHYSPFLVKRGIHAVVDWLPDGERTYRDALRAYSDRLYESLLAESGRDILWDKTPNHARYGDFLTSLYPKAKYIVLTRNPVALRISIIRLFTYLAPYVDLHSRQPFDSEGRHPIDEREIAIEATKVTVAYVRAVSRFVTDGGVPQCHVRLEDLVSRPRRTLARICAHMGLEFCGEMLEYGETPVQMPGILGDPLSTFSHDRPKESVAERWRDALAADADARAEARDLMERFSTAELEKYGYRKDILLGELDA